VIAIGPEGEEFSWSRLNKLVAQERQAAYQWPGVVALVQRPPAPPQLLPCSLCNRLS
jgi:hypothetical protein